MGPLSPGLSPMVCLLGGVQAVGLVASLSARVAEGTRYERAAQVACFAALALVGGLCGFAIQFGPDAAAMSAVTLLIMTMIAVVDVRRRG